MGFLNKILQAQRQAQGEVPAAAPRPTLIQGGPAFFTPEGYTPPIQPEQAFMPTDVMRDPIRDMFAGQPPLTRGPSLPKPPIPPREDQIFIDDMPPIVQEPPMIVEEPPMIDEPTVTMDDIDRIRREREIEIGDIMPPILDRNMIDYGYGPGIRPPLPDDFMIEDSRPEPDPIVPAVVPPKPPLIQERPLGSFENPLFTQIGIGLTGTPIEERSERLLRPIEIPKRIDEMSIERLPALPIEDTMPIRLPEPMPVRPEPMPMLPEPMPVRPRMPMPGPIATPMPMTPINLPKIELPRIERNPPMMTRRRGIGSLM